MPSESQRPQKRPQEPEALRQAREVYVAACAGYQKQPCEVTWRDMVDAARQLDAAELFYRSSPRGTLGT